MTPTYADLAPDTLIRQITQTSPAPIAWVSRAAWLSTLLQSLKKVLAAVEAEYRTAVEIIIENDITDGTYELLPQTKQERLLNAEKLRNENPALYETCAFVNADTVIEWLGKSTLRTILIEKFGHEEVVKHDSVNIDAVKKILGETAMQQYITTLHVPNGYLVRKRLDTPAKETPETVPEVN